MTSHLLVDFPNPVTPQGGWPRRGVSKPSGTCIVHTSEGPWQNGVNALTQFIRTRSDYGSYHRACDWADVAVYYPWEWEAWQDSETNPWAVGIAAACKTSDWAIMPADIREGYYRNMGRMAADFVAYMRDTHGVHVPLRRITGAQARARVPGFCAHGDSGVARSDPGAAFDWGYFFHCTQEALGAGSIAPQSGTITPAPPKGFLMALTDQQQEELLDLARSINHELTGGESGVKHAGDLYLAVHATKKAAEATADQILPGKAGVRQIGATAASLLEIKGAIKVLAEKQGIDPAEFAKAVAAELADGITLEIRTKEQP